MLWLIAMILTLKWDAAGCPGGYMVAVGSPVPADQPKAEVWLKVVKQGAEMPAGSCQTSIDLAPGKWIVALWAGQSPTPPNAMVESNRCTAIVYPDTTPFFTDCPDTIAPGIAAPTNLRMD